MALKFTKLTRLACRKLQPAQRLMEHGITFERLANGDGRFTVNIMVDGVRVHRVIGKESDGVTRQQAEDFIEKARTEARQERLNLPKGRKVALAFQQAAEQYLERLVQEGGKDLRSKRVRLIHHLIPFLGDCSIAKISTFDIERYKKRRQDEGASAGMINRELAALSHLLTKAVEWKWLDHKPATVGRLKEGKGRITYLTAEQIAHLIEAARQDQNPHVYLFIVIGLETSMRRMEILSIRLEHIDLQRLVIYIPQAKQVPGSSLSRSAWPIFYGDTLMRQTKTKSGCFLHLNQKQAMWWQSRKHSVV